MTVASDPAEGMFPETAVEPFTLAPEVEDLAGSVLASFDEFRGLRDAVSLGDLVVAYVFENKDFDPAAEELKHDAIAKVRTVPKIWDTWVQADLVIQVRRWFWDRFDEQARRRTLHHEFSHVELTEHGPRFRHHQVEDFAATLRAFGPRPWHREFFKAYLDWSHEQDRPEPTPIRPVREIAHDVVDATMAGFTDAAREDMHRQVDAAADAMAAEAAQDLVDTIARSGGGSITFTSSAALPGGPSGTIEIPADPAHRDGRVPCPQDGCSYSAENQGSIPAHLAMAHPEVPMDEIAPRRVLDDGRQVDVETGEILEDGQG